MTMGITTHVGVAPLGGLPERRGTGRFPVQEEIRYRVLHLKQGSVSGVGRTLNFGSGGILFTTEQALPLGRVVELSVKWPARLGGTCPLQFVAIGRVVRTEPARAAVRIERYEFKTRRTNTEPPIQKANLAENCMERAGS
jgi:hypothetical protein